MGDFFSDVAGALIPGNSGGLSSVLSEPLNIVQSLTGQTQNKMAAEQFGQSLDWEKYKFNNAHQAEVEDLKAAGLNPVLSADGGQGNTAGSPSTTAQTAHANIGSLMTLLQQLLPNVSQIKNANAAMTAAKAQDKIAGAQALKLTAEAGKLGVDKEIADLEKALKKEQYSDLPKHLRYERSRTPLGLAEEVFRLFNQGSNSAAGQAIENGTFDILRKLNDEKPGFGGLLNQKSFEKAPMAQKIMMIFARWILGQL